MEEREGCKEKRKERRRDGRKETKGSTMDLGSDEGRAEEIVRRMYGHNDRRPHVRTRTHARTYTTHAGYTCRRTVSQYLRCGAATAARKHVETNGLLAGRSAASAVVETTTALIGWRRVRDVGPTQLLAPVTRACRRCRLHLSTLRGQCHTRPDPRRV